MPSLHRQQDLTKLTRCELDSRRLETHRRKILKSEHVQSSCTCSSHRPTLTPTWQFWSVCVTVGCLSVCPSVRLSVPSFNRSVGRFAAERGAGRRYRSTAAGDGRPAAILRRSIQRGTNTRLMAFFRDYPGEPVPERYNQSGFYWIKRQWVAVASAGPYASLHLAPDR